MIRAICDQCKLENEDIKTYTVTITKTPTVQKNMPPYVFGTSSAFNMPELFLSIDLCNKCYPIWKGDVERGAKL